MSDPEFIAAALKTESDDWYTPVVWVDRVRAFYGGTIDLDPASCATANTVVRATRYYTRADDGLVRPWEGRCYVNPPFSRGMRARFLDAAVAAARAGAEVVWLSDHDHSTAWGARLLRDASAYCLPEGRAVFWKQAGLKRVGERPLVVAYMGESVQKFRRHFENYGIVTIVRDNEGKCYVCGVASGKAKHCGDACRTAAYRQRQRAKVQSK